MSEYFEVRTADGVRLQLRRYLPAGVQRPSFATPVLLLHGASANHKTFLVGSHDGLAGWLFSNGFDPWLLDWRGSGLLDRTKNEDVAPREYNFNAAAEYDVPAAVERICRELSSDGDGGKPRLAVLGHCMGGGILAEAVARGHLETLPVDRIVLLALGLFYETPIDGRLKSDERLLEQLVTESDATPALRFINPTVKEADGDGFTLDDAWHPTLENLFRQWPGRLKFHPDNHSGSAAQRCCNEMCDRIAFMYGMPYHHHNLIDDVHGIVDAHGKNTLPPILGDQFGAIPLHMYVHAARNIREGQATFYTKEEPPRPAGATMLDQAARARFQALKSVTLVTGALNRLWHRNSIDLMYEWLGRGTAGRETGRFKKRVFAHYAHQDLLWGRRSAADIFPTIGQGLRNDEPVEGPARASRQRSSAPGRV